MRIDGYKRGVPDVTWWRSQIQAGVKFRKEYALEDDWKRWRQYYRGKWPKNSLPVNLYFRMLRTVVPRIYFRNPSISISPTKGGIEQALLAQLVERVDNKLIRTMGVKGQMKKMIHNAWMFGTAAGKLGFGAQFTPTPDNFETVAPEKGTTRIQRRVEFNSLIEPNMPWFLSVHPGNLVVPEGLSSFEETPWVAMCIRRTIDDIRNDDRFDKSVIANVRGSQLVDSQGVKRKYAPLSEMDVYEIRDMRTRKTFVIAPYMGIDAPLLYDDDAMQVNNRPNIYPVQFNPDDEVFWAVPDSQILEPQQMELNEIRTLQMKHRRMSILKFVYKDNSIDVAEIEKFMSGEVGAGIRLNRSAEVTDIMMMEAGHIPESLMMMDSQVQQDVRDSMGFSRNQSGDYASQKSHNAPTAYEASVVKAASEIRVDERRDAIADVLVQVFEDANVICFDQWEDEQVAMVMGPNSVPMWVSFKPQMLKASRHEMSIDPDSSVPDTKEVRMERALKVYPILKENPLIDPEGLTKYLLRELHGIEYDDLIRKIQQNASSGKPGGSPDNPMGVGDMITQMARGGQAG